MLDQAFEALKSYDWGQDPKVLAPIEEAIVATHGDDAGRVQLEKRLVESLGTELSFDAKQFLCRKLMIVGTAASVPALAALLGDEKLSHMARYALERIPAPEAAAALRDALPNLPASLKVGVISSLGVRQDEAAVPLLAKLLNDSDPAVAQSAAHGLGAIRSAQAAKALTGGSPNPEAESAVTDAVLACAEALVADGKSKEALVIYKGLIGGERPKHVKLAATKGMLACAGKQ